MKQKIITIIIIGIFLIGFIIGLGISSSIQNNKYEKEIEIEKLNYLEDYVRNKTTFNEKFAYLIQGDKMFYYTIDRICMTEKEYVTLYWLDCLKMYNESIIFVDNHGFNKSDIKIIWECEKYDKDYPYKINDSWFISIPDMNLNLLPEEAFGHSYSWNENKRCWILEE